MTREEERKEVAKNRANQYSHPVEWNDCYKHWIEGAEWADKTMIDRACEWLNAFFASHYVMRYHDSCEPVHEYILEGFKKAMEE